MSKTSVNILLFRRSSRGMNILVAEHLISEPVEHVKEQEAEGKKRSGDGVDAFGPLNEAPADLKERVTRGKACKHGRCLRQGSVSTNHARLHAEGIEVQGLIVLSQLLLLWTKTKPSFSK